MTKKDIEIRFVNKWSVEEIVNLYKAGGWWKESWSSLYINNMIKGSFVFAIAIDDKDKTIGMGRVLSDGISDGYIQDLVVLPKYRYLGIGKQIVNKLVNHCLSKGIRWIGLIAEPGNEIFFSSLGFKTMKNHTPMLYNHEE
jgi:ribosomal protein S18 acetylase RimI-like enzyme